MISKIIKIGVFVTGCHRSGTSYLSGFLSAIVGFERNCDFDPTVDNPRGYYESTFFVALNEELLRLVGARWDRPPLAPVAWTQGSYLLEAVRRKGDFRQYALTERWVDKDPRLSLTFPFYRHLLLKRVSCAVILRHPFDVAMSLHLRDGFPIDKGLLIWFIYNRHCSTFLQPQADVLLSYEPLLEGDLDQLERLVNFAGDGCELSHVRELHGQLTQRELRRSRLSESFLDPALQAAPDLVEYCNELHGQVKANRFEIDAYCRAFAAVPTFLIDRCDAILSSGEPSLEYLRLQESAGVAPACSTGDPNQNQEMIGTFADLIESLHRLKVELRDADQTPWPLNEQALHDELAQLRASFSWRITAPLRAIRAGWKCRFG